MNTCVNAPLVMGYSGAIILLKVARDDRWVAS
jgi:hypothetical protein